MARYAVLALMLLSFAGWGGGIAAGKEGILLWTQARPPSPFLALRLEMQVNADPAALLKVLRIRRATRSGCPGAAKSGCWQGPVPTMIWCTPDCLPPAGSGQGVDHPFPSE